MANGDIQFGDITEDQFKGFSEDHQKWILYTSVRSLSSTCHSRPGNCDKRYVRRKHVCIAILAIIVFLIGAGFKINGILEMMVKAALAGAL